MPSSFLKRHRTICNVLEQIRLEGDNTPNGDKISKLVDEAKGYAQSMSKKLVTRKNEVKVLKEMIVNLTEPKPEPPLVARYEDEGD